MGTARRRPSLAAAHRLHRRRGRTPTSTSSPGGQGSSTGYVGSLADIIGIATPLTQTTIKPRLDYRDYPNDSSDNRLEGYLDFDSSYKSQRSSAEHQRARSIIATSSTPS